jgi:hypothetical protein
VAFACPLANKAIEAGSCYKEWGPDLDSGDLIVWLPETPHWRIGLRLADGHKLVNIIAPKIPGITGSWNVSWGRFEAPLTLTDNVAGYLGRLERYINGQAAEAFAERIPV